jgi:hypothetical protein
MTINGPMEGLGASGKMVRTMREEELVQLRESAAQLQNERKDIESVG